jgi:hypothetical protein
MAAKGTREREREREQQRQLLLRKSKEEYKKKLIFLCLVSVFQHNIGQIKKSYDFNGWMSFFNRSH